MLGARVALHAGRGADPVDPSAILIALLASPSVASKKWAFEQYDSVVLSHTVRRPEAADAAVLHLHEAGASIAVAIDGNGAASPAIPTRARSRLCSSARRTWPARAPSRSG